jgi:outer membrane protein assembly factor BamD
MLGPQRDQTATHEALRELQRFLDNYPNSKYRDEVLALQRSAQDRLSEGEFKVGQLYYRIRNYLGAINRFAGLLKQDPTYSKRDEVWFYMGETYRKTNALPEALPYYDRILKEKPDSEYKERAEQRIAEIKRLLDSAGVQGTPKTGAASGS